MVLTIELVRDAVLGLALLATSVAGFMITMWYLAYLGFTTVRDKRKKR